MVFSAAVIYDSRNYLVLIDSYFLQNYIKFFI